MLKQNENTRARACVEQIIRCSMINTYLLKMLFKCLYRYALGYYATLTIRRRKRVDKRSVLTLRNKCICHVGVCVVKFLYYPFEECIFESLCKKIIDLIEQKAKNEKLPGEREQSKQKRRES